MNRRRFFLHCTAALGASSSPPVARAQQRDTILDSLARERLEPTTRNAVDRGLAYLARIQNPDGSYGGGGYSRNVAICSLAGMAFMAAGNTPGRGPYGLEVRRTVRFILDNVQDSGYIHAAEAASRGPMYGHGFATLFLAEAYGTWQDSEARRKLSKAVNLIISTQNDEGGWRYFPRPDDADISVTVCQVMALRAARNAGLYVPSETIDRCVAYVKRSQNDDGGFMYMLQQGGPSRFPRSAAGVVALQSAGIYQSREVRKGLDYLMQHIPRADAFNRESYYFYGQYYAAQAMYQAGGQEWRQWRQAIQDVLPPRQKDDGSWYDSVSSEYGTAMACIVLQMSNSHLPIFQR